MGPRCNVLYVNAVIREIGPPFHFAFELMKSCNDINARLLATIIGIFNYYTNLIKCSAEINIFYWKSFFHFALFFCRGLGDSFLNDSAVVFVLRRIVFNVDC